MRKVALDTMRFVRIVAIALATSSILLSAQTLETQAQEKVSPYTHRRAIDPLPSSTYYAALSMS